MLLGAIGRRDACLLPRPEQTASTNWLSVCLSLTTITQIERGIFLFFYVFFFDSRLRQGYQDTFVHIL